MGIIPSHRRGNRGSGRSRDRPEVTGLRHGGELNSGSGTLVCALSGHAPKTATPICPVTVLAKRGWRWSPASRWDPRPCAPAPGAATNYMWGVGRCSGPHNSPGRWTVAVLILWIGKLRKVPSPLPTSTASRQQGWDPGSEPLSVCL